MLIKKFTTEYIFTTGIRQIEVYPFDIGKTLYVNQTALDENTEEFLLTPHEYVEAEFLFDSEYDALKAGIDLLKNRINQEAEKLAKFEKIQDELKVQLRKFENSCDEDPATW